MNINEYNKQMASISELGNTAPIAQGQKNSLDAKCWKAVENVSQKASEIFQEIKFSAPQSHQARIDLYHSLVEQLQVVEKTINGSKSLWQRIISIFTYLSIAEKELHKTLEVVKKAEKEEIDYESRLWTPQKLQDNPWIVPLAKVLKFIDLPTIPLSRKEWRERVDATQGKFLETQIGRLRLIYHRVIGQEKLSSSLEGMSFAGSLKTVRQELEEFADISRSLLNQEALEEFKAKAEKLKFAQHILQEADILSQITDKSESSMRSRLADIAYNIQMELNALPEGEELLLPGGYASPEGGHAVLYSIRKKPDGTFSFTIINTGLGAETFAGWGSLFRSVFFDGKFSDYVIEDLKPERLMETNFLIDLMGMKVSLPENSMEKTFKLIVDHLLEGNPNKFREGRRHAIQTNGTCTHDSVCSWLESTLSEELFHAFNLYITGKGLYRLDTLLDGEVLTHEVSEIHGMSSEEKLKGLDLIKRMKHIGEKRFAERQQVLVDLEEKTGAALDRVSFSIQRMQDSRQKLTDAFDATKIDTEIDQLQKEAVQLNQQVQAESETKRREADAQWFYTRITQKAMELIGPASALATQLHSVQAKISELEQRRQLLDSPEKQQEIQEKIAEIDGVITTNQDEFSRLQKKKNHLVRFLRERETLFRK